MYPSLGVRTGMYPRGKGTLHTNPSLRVPTVRAVTDCDPGGLYAPDDICTKTGRRVLDVLYEKHPDAHIPKERAFDSYANSTELLEAMPIDCYEEQIST